MIEALLALRERPAEASTHGHVEMLESHPVMTIAVHALAGYVLYKYGTIVGYRRALLDAPID